MSEKVTFTDEEGNEEEFYIIEKTRVNGRDYLLVSDDFGGGGDGNAYILKDDSSPDDEYSEFEFVDGDDELAAVAGVFNEMLDDIDVI